MNFSSRLRYIKSKTHIHKEKYDIVVEEYEITEPQIDEIDWRLDNVIKDCSIKFIHIFEYRCVYDIKFTNNKNIEKVNSTITHG